MIVIPDHWRETALVEPGDRELHQMAVLLVQIISTVRHSVTFRGERQAGAVSASELLLRAATNIVEIQK